VRATTIRARFTTKTALFSVTPDRERLEASRNGRVRDEEQFD
jgi:hypothetical protein